VSDFDVHHEDFILNDVSIRKPTVNRSSNSCTDALVSLLISDLEAQLYCAFLIAEEAKQRVSNV